MNQINLYNLDMNDINDLNIEFNSNTYKRY